MKRSILVVEEEENTRWAMEGFFRAHGLEVKGARDLRSAEDALAARRFDVVITGLELVEEGDGLVIVAAARRRNPPSPVIVLTAQGSPEVLAIARQLGAARVLVKPQPLVELHRIAVELINQGGGPDRAEAGSRTGA